MADKLISSITESIGVWAGKTFLIVEDVVSNYYYLEATLKKSGVNLVWAKSGEEALELIDNSKPYDLVLMDVQLTGIDGYEVTRKIKEKNSSIPIIAQTAYAMLGEKEKSQFAGCDEYLSKPIRPTILLQTISKLIS
ncbi:MAG TPA: response regulator [Lentimicrobium sp.]|jgi:CheY-like chemotaxis protein|nr:response regulator [Lentimicrobium sp.]